MSFVALGMELTPFPPRNTYYTHTAVGRVIVMIDRFNNHRDRATLSVLSAPANYPVDADRK